MLLAVDLGLRTGLALYGRDGRLIWYRSQNFGAVARLRRGVYGLLGELAGLEALTLEGGGPLAEIWRHETERRGILVMQISAETWRRRLFYDREQRSGVQAKQSADDMARRVIAWAGAPRPTALRHDTAEAILIGLWSVLELGWLPQMPAEVRRG